MKKGAVVIRYVANDGRLVEVMGRTPLDRYPFRPLVIFGTKITPEQAGELAVLLKRMQDGQERMASGWLREAWGEDEMRAMERQSVDWLREQPRDEYVYTWGPSGPPTLEPIDYAYYKAVDEAKALGVGEVALLGCSVCGHKWWKPNDGRIYICSACGVGACATRPGTTPEAAPRNPAR